MMEQEYSIKCGLLTDQEIKFIEGYMWKNDGTTMHAFYQQKEHDLGGYAKGAIALDLYKGIDLVDTVTVSKEHFKELRNAI